MPRFFNSRKLNTKAHRQLSRFRTVCLAMLAVTATNFSGPHYAQAAPPGIEIVVRSVGLQASPQSLKVCEHGSAEIKISVYERTWRFPPSSDPNARSTRNFANTDVFLLDNSNPQAGHLYANNNHASTDAAGGGAIFQFVAEKAGRTTLEFTAIATTDSGPQRREVSVEVEVIKCKYQLVVKSEWQFTKGWKPLVVVIFDTWLEPDENGAFDQLVAYNVAANWTVPLPYPCIHPQPETGSSKVRVSGQFIGDGYVSINLQYDRIQEKQEFNCPYIKTTTRPDVGLPDDLVLLLDVKPPGTYIHTGETETESHTLFADEDIDGKATIILETEPQ